MAPRLSPFIRTSNVIFPRHPPRREFTGWNNWWKTKEAPHEWNWCSKQTQAPGRRGWEGGKTKATWKRETTNNLKRKHRLKTLRKESKDFARVGWILDYGLRIQEEEGRAGGKKTTEDWTCKNKEGQTDLTRNAPDKRGWTTHETNCVNLKKVWKGRGVIQNTYVKIPHQRDEGAEE